MTYTQRIEIEAMEPNVAIATPTTNGKWYDGDQLFYGAIATVTVTGEFFDGGRTEPSGLDLDYDSIAVEFDRITLCSDGEQEIVISEDLANHIGFLGNLTEMIKDIAIDKADWRKEEDAE